MSALVMVDDNLELEEDSFKFLVETLQKISSNCRQKYSVIGTGNVTKDFPSLLMRKGWGKVSNMDKLSKLYREN